MKKPILCPLVTLLICAVVLLAISAALNGMATERAAQSRLELLSTLLPGGEGFSEEAYTGEDANIRSVYKAKNGCVIETCTYGYAGDVTMLIGVANSGKVTGLMVLEAHETPGLGNNALTDTDFLAQFLNKTGEFTVSTGSADAFSGATGTVDAENALEVDAITGATVTSKAIARSVTSACGYVTGADVVSSATSWGG